jgi:hypothetical protein
MIVWPSAFRMTVGSFFCFGTKKHDYEGAAGSDEDCRSAGV